MRTIGNLLWFCVGGGFFLWVFWLLLSALAFVSIIGIPYGRACYKISKLAADPFGHTSISRRDLTKKRDIGTSLFGLVGNVIWFVIAGFWLMLGHIVSGLLCCTTIIGIPFGVQHFKLAALSIAPIGKAVVKKELAEAAAREDALAELTKMRSQA